MSRIKARPDGLAWRQVGDDVVLLDERRSVYLQLVGSGALLWPKIVDGAEVDELTGLLSEHFGIDESTARRDVDAFIADLLTRELVEVETA